MPQSPGHPMITGKCCETMPPGPMLKRSMNNEGVPVTPPTHLKKPSMNPGPMGSDR